MPNCNFNACYCGPYYPRPINTCSCLNRCNVGNIINPSIPREWAVFLLTTSQAVEQNATIPVALSNSSGSSITDAGAGNITLTPGTYEISYMADIVLPTGTTSSVAIENNGVEIPGTLTNMTGTAGQVVNLSNKIILNFTETALLTLVNATGETVTVDNATISILKL